MSRFARPPLIIVSLLAILHLTSHEVSATCRLRRAYRHTGAQQQQASAGGIGLLGILSAVPTVLNVVREVKTTVDSFNEPAPQQQFECDISNTSGLPTNPQLKEARESLERINLKLGITNTTPPSPVPDPQLPANAPPPPTAPIPDPVLPPGLNLN